MHRDLPGRLEASNPPPITARAELVRTVWTLAWPVIVALFSEAMVGLVDMLMVGRLGADAVAGVGVGAQILGAVSVVGGRIGAGTVARVARRVGAGWPALARRALGQRVILAVGLGGLAIMPVIVWTAPIVGLFGIGPGVVELGVALTRLVMLSIP